jgi:hypothetical protein
MIELILSFAFFIFLLPANGLKATGNPSPSPAYTRAYESLRSAAATVGTPPDFPDDKNIADIFVLNYAKTCISRNGIRPNTPKMP